MLCVLKPSSFFTGHLTFEVETITLLTNPISTFHRWYTKRVKVKLPQNRPSWPRGEQGYSSTVSLTSVLDGDCGARGGVVVKALRYKPAGREFDSRWCQWNFSAT